MNPTQLPPSGSPLIPPATTTHQGQRADQRLDPRLNAGEHRAPALGEAGLADRPLSPDEPQLRRSQNLQDVPAPVIKTGVLPFLEYRDQHALSLASKHLHAVADDMAAQYQKIAHQVGAVDRLFQRARHAESVREYLIALPGSEVATMYVQEKLASLKLNIEQIERRGADWLTDEFEYEVFGGAMILASEPDCDLLRMAFRSRDPEALVDVINKICESWQDDAKASQAKAEALQKDFERAEKALFDAAPAMMLARENRGFRTARRDILILNDTLEKIRDGRFHSADWQQALKAADLHASDDRKWELGSAHDRADTNELQRLLRDIIKSEIRESLANQDAEFVEQIRGLDQLLPLASQLWKGGTAFLQRILDSLKDDIATIERGGARCLTADFEKNVFGRAQALASDADRDFMRTAFRSRNPKELVDVLKAICERWQDSPDGSQAKAKALLQEKTLIERAPAMMLARENRGFRTPRHDILILNEALRTIQNEGLDSVDWRRTFKSATRIANGFRVELLSNAVVAMDTNEVELALRAIIKAAVFEEFSSYYPHRDERLADHRVVVDYSDSPVPPDPSRPQTIRVVHTGTDGGIKREHSHTGAKPHVSRLKVEVGDRTLYFIHRFNVDARPAPSIDMEKPD